MTPSSSLFLQLRKAVMDHISDSFLETNVPLLVLIEAAKSGNEKEVKEYAQVFREHANKLVEVSHTLYMKGTNIYPHIHFLIHWSEILRCYVQIYDQCRSGHLNGVRNFNKAFC